MQNSHSGTCESWTYNAIFHVDHVCGGYVRDEDGEDESLT